MSLTKSDYYAIECDEHGCTVATRDLGDFAAWAEAGSAEEEWVEAGGQVVDRDGRTRYFCEDHRQGEGDES